MKDVESHYESMRPAPRSFPITGITSLKQKPTRRSRPSWPSARFRVPNADLALKYTVFDFRHSILARRKPSRQLRTRRWHILREHGDSCALHPLKMPVLLQDHCPLVLKQTTLARVLSPMAAELSVLCEYRVYR